MTFIEHVENSLIPIYYDYSLEADTPIDLLLMKKKAMARYVLVVKSLEDNFDLETEIAQVRREVRNQTRAFWLFREVGAYVVFRVNTLPKLKPADILVDKTGFHAVIIQGVHLVSASGQHLFNHSKWLNHTFGGAVGISERIEAIET